MQVEGQQVCEDTNTATHLDHMVMMIERDYFLESESESENFIDPRGKLFCSRCSVYKYK